jgi:hypothetical protein
MYIFCDCSDCGNTRIKGPCYLELYYKNMQSKNYLNQLRRRNTKLKETHTNYIEVEDIQLFKDSVLRVSVV